MIMVHVQVFLYEDIMDPKWIFVIHYDQILRHVFDDALMDNEQNNDIQPILAEILRTMKKWPPMVMFKMKMFKHRKMKMKMFKHNMKKKSFY